LLRVIARSEATKQSIFCLGDGHALLVLLIAGFIAQILVQPPGALASVPDWLRYAAVAAGFAAFIATRRSTLAGMVCGELVMLAGKWWIG
jgi:hypothetical protein